MDWSDYIFYLSGPMSGYPKYNYDTFERVSRVLRVNGFNIVSPHENPAPIEKLDEEKKWQYYMALCHKQMERCNAIILLQGWPESRGSREELATMVARGARVFFFKENSTYLLIDMSRGKGDAKDT